MMDAHVPVLEAGLFGRISSVCDVIWKRHADLDKDPIPDRKTMQELFEVVFGRVTDLLR
jgi:hypothetical protein